MERPEIREADAGDRAAILALYPEAFPEEDLTPLVAALLEGTPEALSLVAEADGAVRGHVAFTLCGVGDAAGAAALLGPLVVASAWRSHGVGGGLVRAGLDAMAARGARLALVLGDPAYYRRFGFAAETGVTTPAPIPPEWAEAWMSLTLGPGPRPAPGPLTPPAAWRDPALWAP